MKKSYEKAERELVVKLQEVQAYHRQSTTSINNDNNNNNNKIQSSITDSKSNEALVARLLELEQQFTRFKEQPHLWTAHGDERTFQEQLISAQQGLKTALERNLDIEKLLAEYSEQIDRLREQRRRLETDYAKLVKSSEESSKESDIAILNLKEQVKKNSFAVDQLTVISQLQSTVRELKQENADLSTR